MIHRCLTSFATQTKCGTTLLHTRLQVSRIISRTKHHSSKMDDLALISATQALRLWSENPQHIKFLDASWHMDKSRDPKAEYAEERLPGANYFDIDEISDKSSALPHMLPTQREFTTVARAMGLYNDNHIVIYTKPNCFSAARCWWMFQVMNHSQVSVLDGGIDAWKTAGGPTEPGNESIPPSSASSAPDFKAKLVPQRLITWDQVLESIGRENTSGRKEIVDARSIARFEGSAPEPRPGLRSGHMPTATCVPFTSLLQADWSYWKPVSEIKKVFEEAGIDLNEDSRVITSCGSGVTACVLSFGMHLCGKAVNSVPVYDGSWAEWASRDDLPVESSSEHK